MARKIHSTAIVDAGAQLGEDVEIGPHVMIEPDVTIGDGCRIMVGAVILRYTIMGPGNVVHPYAVLGGHPQDVKFDPASETYLRIGSGNVFREYVNFSRATTPGGATVVGNNCYFMAGSHVGHDSVISDGVTLTNAAAIAGHVEIHRNAFLSAHTLVHQYCWVGELVMARGHAGLTQHAPPFVILWNMNRVAGLNTVGLRRAEHITAEDRKQIKEAYRMLYRSSLFPERALERMDACTDWGEAAGRLRDFVRRVITAERPYNRGLVPALPYRRGGT